MNDLFDNIRAGVQPWTRGRVTYEYLSDGSLHMTSNGEPVVGPVSGLLVTYQKVPLWLKLGKRYVFYQAPANGVYSLTYLNIGDKSYKLTNGKMFDLAEEESAYVTVSISYQARFAPGEPVDATVKFSLYEVDTMNNSSNVTVGKPKIVGGIYRAPIGTTLPTDAVTDLASAFISLGYIAEGGVQNNFSQTTENYRAWGGDIVLTYGTDSTDTFAFGMIETVGNLEVQKTWFGNDNVSGTLETGITARANAKELEDAVYVIDMTLRGGVLRRIVIPKGKLTERGEVTYADEDVVNYPATITAQAGADGDTHKEYTQAAST